MSNINTLSGLSSSGFLNKTVYLMLESRPFEEFPIRSMVCDCEDVGNLCYDVIKYTEIRQRNGESRQWL